MRIAGIQISAGQDIEKNISRAVEMGGVAAEKGAKVICYPELCFLPWFPMEEEPVRSLACEATGEALKPFAELSRKTRTVLVVPFFESHKKKFYNSAAVIDDGKVAGVYRKVHLPDLPHYREQAHFASGDGGFPVFKTSHGTIGIQICWDNLFPEGSRSLALRGADIIVAPNAASQDTHHLWEKAVTANAFANNVYVFRVNRVGQEDGIGFYGRSFCAGPWGEMASELAGSKDAIVLARVDQKELAHARETWGFLKHRRPNEYGELVK